MSRSRKLKRLFTLRGWWDTWRGILKVRVHRALPAAGSMPEPGSYIAREDVRVRVTEEITPELWRWLAERGWREIDLARDRRRYRAGMPSTIEELSFAETPEKLEQIERMVCRSAQMSTYEIKRKASRPRKAA